MDLCNYAAKADLKGATNIDTFTAASKTDLAGLKIKVDNLDVDKLRIFLADLSNLSNVVDNDVVCDCVKTVYGKLVAKVNAIGTKIPNTSGLVIKTKYDSEKQDLNEEIEEVDQKIPNTKCAVQND